MKRDQKRIAKSPQTTKQRGQLKTTRLLLDVDILTWLKKDGRGYQARANQIFRELMLKEIETQVP